MGNKTLYIKDKDEAMLKELEEISGESYSALFARLAAEELERLKEKQKAREGKVSKLTVRYKDKDGINRRYSFVGRWIVKGYETSNHTFSVAITENDRLFVLIEKKDDDDGFHLVHEDFSEMQVVELWKIGSYPDELLAKVAGEIGEEYEAIEEVLDI